MSFHVACVDRPRLRRVDRGALPATDPYVLPLKAWVAKAGACNTGDCWEYMLWGGCNPLLNATTDTLRKTSLEALVATNSLPVFGSMSCTIAWAKASHGSLV
eukprot:m.173488 g.173488  ORF g.173488 m.173488 type:complete len:102 (-) comp16738_c0_seq1:1633-1938(-)